jgi:hypothetical protein
MLAGIQQHRSIWYNNLWHILHGTAQLVKIDKGVPHYMLLHGTDQMLSLTY